MVRSVGCCVHCSPHDGRLAEDPLRFVKVYESTPPNGGGGSDPDWQQEALALKEASQGHLRPCRPSIRAGKAWPPCVTGN